MLLIADEINDVIHVVDVQNDRLTFSRFLTPGCPLLLQPTALNTDHRGRLWVNCVAEWRGRAGEGGRGGGGAEGGAEGDF